MFFTYLFLCSANIFYLKTKYSIIFKYKMGLLLIIKINTAERTVEYTYLKIEFLATNVIL